MLRRFVAAILAAALLCFAAFWVLTKPQTLSADALAAHTPDLGNGRTLFYAGDCASCHATPTQKDMTRLGGGRALKTKFGIFYPPNISSDRADGIGAWSEAEFITAMTKGIGPGGRQLYPVFPYTSFQRITDSDLADLFAFIKTLPAVKGRAPADEVSFPFSFRRFIGLWKLLYLDGEPFQPDPDRSDIWNRGAYLANGAGHCAECHSPRNFLGGVVKGERFAGGPNPVDKGWVPNITQQHLAKWLVKDIAYLLDTGMTLNGDSVGSSMSEVVKNLSHLSNDDRMAIATYIKSLPPVAGPTPPKKKKQ
jgi:mono/diheme cytochrome c family protein